MQTDGEIDDQSSMIRFLLYASDFDIAGIVQQNSVFQPNGHSTEGWLDEEIDIYESILPNLRVHNPDYPSADYLRSIAKVGNETASDLTKAPQDMSTKNTPGEQLIIDTLLDDDPRPLLVATWGGANTLASALWTIKTQHSPEDLARAIAKLRVYAIWYQDNGGRWIDKNFPGVKIFESYRWDDVWDYESTTGPAPAEIRQLMTTEWLNENVKSVGPLGAHYQQATISEGDSPSFFPAIANGLQDGYADFAEGTWGGRGAQDLPYLKPGHFTDTAISDDGDVKKMFWRWVPAAQSDFAARLQWSVSPVYSDANHAPVTDDIAGTHRVAAPGASVTLDLTGATDPDGDDLNYTFWQYSDADSVRAEVPISQNGDGTASLIVPNEIGTTIEVIGEVSDDGTPALTSYRRFTIVIGQHQTVTATRPADSIDWSAAKNIETSSDVSTSGRLIRAVDLGAAVGADPLTVNGVDFEPASYDRLQDRLSNGDSVYVSDGPFGVQPGPAQLELAGGSNALGSAGGPLAQVPGSYRSLLRTGFYNEARNAPVFGVPISLGERAGHRLVLRNLTPGTTYEFQAFVNDSRLNNLGVTSNPDLSTYISDGGGGVSLQLNVQNVEGGTGQTVTGRFTASSDTKEITLTADNGTGDALNRVSVINAYQLRTAVVEGTTPVISGNVRVGDTVSATVGTWTDGSTLSYQWLADGTPIAGATGSTLTLTAAELGKSIAVAVTGSKAGYDAVTLTSAASRGVASAASATSTTMLSVSKAKVVAGGDPLVLTARVAGAAGGSVEFFDRATSLGVTAVGADGIATFTVSSPTVGTHGYTATYSGAANVASSSSGATIAKVIKATAKKVKVTGKSFTRNSKPSFTVSVSTLDNGQKASGKVRLYINGKASKTVKLGASGKVSVTLTKKYSKAIRVKAVYLGNSITERKTSASYVIKVKR